VSNPEPTGQLYELRITASGEVRDADGNLVSSPTAESTHLVTEQEARAILERQGES
jgi:hypothetical protein